MPNAATTAKRLADMTRKREEFMCKHIMSFEKKTGVMKMYKCIDTEVLAGKKKHAKIHYLMLEAIVVENQGQVNRAM